jgi:hypothetical protein
MLIAKLYSDHAGCATLAFEIIKYLHRPPYLSTVQAYCRWVSGCAALAIKHCIAIMGFGLCSSEYYHFCLHIVNLTISWKVFFATYDNIWIIVIYHSLIEHQALVYKEQNFNIPQIHFFEQILKHGDSCGGCLACPMSSGTTQNRQCKIRSQWGP